MNGDLTESTTDGIVLVGQARWVRQFERGLLDYAGVRIGVVPVDGALDILRPAALRLLHEARLVVRVGFRPGSTTWRGRAADALLGTVAPRTSRRAVGYYWMGTDVAGVVRDLAAPGSDGLRRELLASTHLVVSDNLQSELASAGVQSVVVPHGYETIPRGTAIHPLPTRFTVLTYIPRQRQEFYGLSSILEAAVLLPETHFIIVGSGRGEHVPNVDNVDFAGWQDDLTQYFINSSVLVRMTEHDGVAGTVVEALSYGRPAIFSQPRAHTIHVPYGDVRGLVEAIANLRARSANGEDLVSPEVVMQIRDHYDPARCYPELRDALVSMLPREQAE